MHPEVLYADIFMYPNSLQVCEDFGMYGYVVQNSKGLQVCFESWITNSECENWGRHGHPKVGRFSDRIPVELFMGKREGDQVELVINGFTVIVTLAQEKYRYHSYGKFENLLYDLTKSFGGICDKKYFTPELSEKEQANMLYANHENYCRSLGFEIVEWSKFRYYRQYSEN